MIDSSNPNKFLDGLPNEYYKTFKSTLSPFLLAMFQHIIAEKLPPKEMLQPTVITIPEPGKPTDILANYWPISLLNCDIKLFSKLMADWIKFELLIHSDLVRFVAHTQAWDSTWKILNLIQLAELKSTDSVIISLDAEKVFDRVSWSFLSQVLTKFGFKNNIFHVVMLKNSWQSPHAETTLPNLFCLQCLTCFKPGINLW